MEELTNERQKTFWDSVIFAGAMMAVVLFALTTIIGYIQINSEPDGSLLQPSMSGSIVVCLIGAFAGMLAVWHYAKYVSPTLTLGRGAWLGVITGLVVVFGQNLLMTIWTWIDPDYTKMLMESLIANFEAMDMPENLKQQQIDMMAQQYRSVGSFWGFLKQVLFGFPLYGILNIITAMIGVKAFGREKEV